MGVDPLARMVDLPGGTFRMGTDDPSRYPGDGEGPVREVELTPFAIAATAARHDALYAEVFSEEERESVEGIVADDRFLLSNGGGGRGIV